MKYGPMIVGECVANWGDPTVVRTFEELRKEADAGLEYEKAHGQWSLLKHDHPATVGLKARGYYSGVDLFQSDPRD